MPDVSLMWFRRDLRLADNDALAMATAASREVGLLACRVPEHETGTVAARWRAASLATLAAEVRARGGSLAYRDSDSLSAVLDAVDSSGATTVWCTRDWTPEGRAEEQALAEALRGRGVRLELRGGAYLCDPDSLVTAEGGPYRVYTPYYKRWARSWTPEPPHDAPEALRCPAALEPGSLPTCASSPSGTEAGPWKPGEAGAAARLARFCRESLNGYATDRDRPALSATSELSPHLAFGEISPRAVAWEVTRADAPAGDVDKFLAEMAWREFAASVMWHYPETADRPMRAEFSAFPWRFAPEDFAAWVDGRTGFPIVDAGMRQLSSSGWMHNRVRLIVGSFLTKDLLIPWQSGERHFAETLVDYDPASNAFNWQWVSGCGADAAPYFRIFNPMIQGGRFDPDGSFVRRWVPELAAVPSRWIHAPWTAPAEVLADARVELGEGYPLPVVDHFEARDRALAAFAALHDPTPKSR